MKSNEETVDQNWPEMSIVPIVLITSSKWRSAMKKVIFKFTLKKSVLISTSGDHLPIEVSQFNKVIEFHKKFLLHQWNMTWKWYKSILWAAAIQQCNFCRSWWFLHKPGSVCYLGIHTSLIYCLTFFFNQPVSFSLQLL